MSVMVLIESIWNLKVKMRTFEILVISNCLIHEHDMSFHLFRSSLMFYSSLYGIPVCLSLSSFLSILQFLIPL